MNNPSTTESMPTLRRRIWVLSFLIFTALGVTMVVQTYAFDRSVGQPLDLKRVIISTFVSFWIYALLTPAVILFSWRFPIEKRNWFRRVLLHIVAGIVFTALHSAGRPLAYPFRVRAAPDVQGRLTWTIFKNTFLFFSFDNIFNTYFPIVGFSHVWLYYHRLRQREVRSARLEAQLANAQLSMLKTQLQPHFLFNTLHAVSALIRDNPRAAEDMLEGLGELLRLSLEQQVTQEVALKTELDFIGRYLRLEEIRFADSLRVVVAADPDTLDALVPSMILQPLVENALRHGISKRSKGGLLQIRAVQTGTQLCLTVEDNGPGDNASAVAPRKEGIGLTNTRSRLQQLYGSEHDFEIINTPGRGTVVTVHVPFRLIEPGPAPAGDAFGTAREEELRYSA